MSAVYIVSSSDLCLCLLLRLHGHCDLPALGADNTGVCSTNHFWCLAKVVIRQTPTWQY